MRTISSIKTYSKKIENPEALKNPKILQKAKIIRQPPNPFQPIQPQNHAFHPSSEKPNFATNNHSNFSSTFSSNRGNCGQHCGGGRSRGGRNGSGGRRLTCNYVGNKATRFRGASIAFASDSTEQTPTTTEDTQAVATMVGIQATTPTLRVALFNPTTVTTR